MAPPLAAPVAVGGESGGACGSSASPAGFRERCSNSAGELLDTGFAEVLALIESDGRFGVCAARGFRLHPACEPQSELLDYLETVFSGGRRDWRCVMNKRIGISYKEKNPALVWLDDKVKQVAQTAAMLDGQERHLPIYAHASLGPSAPAELEALREIVRGKVAAGQALVVKPRHGSNSRHVSVWQSPQESDEAEIFACVEQAMDSWDRSWKKESWNQNAVPKGVLLQPMYASMRSFFPAGQSPDEGIAAAEYASPRLSKPLELKIQVLFGEVLGACLNTHPQFLWVSREGAVHLWDQSHPGFLARHAGAKEPLHEIVVDVLRRELRDHWPSIRRDSEELARAIGLDELRVDWLLGDPRWGPRIGELTYMGTFALDVVPVSKGVARAYSAAHLARLGRPVRDGSF